MKKCKECEYAKAYNVSLKKAMCVATRTERASSRLSFTARRLPGNARYGMEGRNEAQKEKPPRGGGVPRRAYRDGGRFHKGLERGARVVIASVFRVLFAVRIKVPNDAEHGIFETCDRGVLPEEIFGRLAPCTLAGDGLVKDYIYIARHICGNRPDVRLGSDGVERIFADYPLSGVTDFICAPDFSAVLRTVESSSS